MSDPSEHPSTNWTRGLWRPREVIEAGRNESIERAKKEGNCRSKEGRLLRANEVVGQTKKEGDYRTGGRGVRGENWTSANQDAESVKRTKGLGGVLLARERDKVSNERRGVVWRSGRDERSVVVQSERNEKIGRGWCSLGDPISF